MIKYVSDLPYYYIWIPAILIAAFAFFIWAVSPYLNKEKSDGI